MSIVSTKAMSFVETVITPELAAGWLAQSGGNRPIRETRVAKYVRDLEFMRWHLTHQAIAFDVNGVLRDGHHRLTAIVRSGIPARIMVAYNVPLDGLNYIDSGLARNSRDGISMAGRGNYGHEYIAVVRNLWRLPSSGTPNPTNDELLAAIHATQDCVGFACEHLPNGTPGISRGVRVLAARAWFHVDRERLTSFCEILNSGLPTNPTEDSAAISFSRNVLLKPDSKGGNFIESIKYKKGQSALQAFLKRQPLTVIKATELDLFPMPEDRPCPWIEA